MSRSSKILVLLASAAAACWSQEAFGTWKANPARSTFGAEPRAKEIVLRIERHPKGEAVTLDRILPNGVASTTSIILSLDGQPREFRGERCSGLQSSKRLGDQTVEVRFQCQDGRSVRIVRRVSRDLILEIVDQPSGGRPAEWRLVFEKQ